MDGNQRKGDGWEEGGQEERAHPRTHFRSKKCWGVRLPTWKLRELRTAGLRGPSQQIIYWTCSSNRQEWWGSWETELSRPPSKVVSGQVKTKTQFALGKLESFIKFKTKFLFSHIPLWVCVCVCVCVCVYCKISKSFPDEYSQTYTKVENQIMQPHKHTTHDKTIIKVLPHLLHQTFNLFLIQIL